MIVECERTLAGLRQQHLDAKRSRGPNQDHSVRPVLLLVPSHHGRRSQSILSHLVLVTPFTRFLPSDSKYAFLAPFGRHAGAAALIIRLRCAPVLAHRRDQKWPYSGPLGRKSQRRDRVPRNPICAASGRRPAICGTGSLRRLWTSCCR